MAACMDRRECTERRQKIDRRVDKKISTINKKLEELENIVTTISKLLIDKKIYTTDEVLTNYSRAVKTNKEAENKLNLVSEMTVENQITIK